MSQLRVVILCVCLTVALGCRTSSSARIATAPNSPRSVAVSRPAPPESQATAHNSTLSPLRPASFQEQLPVPSPPVVVVEEVPANLDGELQLESLVAAVEARYPSLQAMTAAWQAAAQRYPQVVALEDPVLMGTMAPASASSDLTETAYALQLNQKLPWIGKRRLRGAAAAADADAALNDVEDSRLQVRLVAEMAFYEYFLVARLVTLNRDNTRIMEQFRETAQSKYRANQVTQQDVLQADVELADLQRRQFELERMQQVAVARINTLLRRWPDAPLPGPPAELDPPQRVADANLLWQNAMRQRPDLAALAWRVQSTEAALELAYKDFYPDFDVFGRYDTFWQPASTQGPLRGQVGVSVNMPIYYSRLKAAVREAQCRVNQQRAEFDQQALDIQYEVVTAARQVEESHRTVDLYAQRLLPVAEQNVAAARANYEVGKLNFLDLAQAQRQLIMARERQIEAIITYQRRIAELRRSTGGLIVEAP